MALFDEEYSDNLPIDQLQAIKIILRDYVTLRSDAYNAGTWQTKHYSSFASLYAYSVALWKKIANQDISKNFSAATSKNQIMGIINDAMNELNSRVLRVDLNAAVGVASKKIDSKLNSVFYILIEESDVSRIQEIINELREIVIKTEDFDENHRRRFLKRLEKMQSELNKKMSDVDVFWGGFVDAAAALGKFGDKAKPFFDRMKDIRDIVWGAQRKTEGLESSEDTPQLPKFDE